MKRIAIAYNEVVDVSNSVAASNNHLSFTLLHGTAHKFLVVHNAPWQLAFPISHTRSRTNTRAHTYRSTEHLLCENLFIIISVLFYFTENSAEART